MRTPIKFRYKDADGADYFKEINLPPDAAQLVGYDGDGREVYVGDPLLNPYDFTTFKAAMNHIYTVKRYQLVTKEEIS